MATPDRACRAEYGRAVMSPQHSSACELPCTCDGPLTKSSRPSPSKLQGVLRTFAVQKRHSVLEHRVFSESKSGRDAEGRSEFLRLIGIITSGTADFEAVLVRDVSRWGRFDNADQAAYYDFLCLRMPESSLGITHVSKPSRAFCS